MLAYSVSAFSPSQTVLRVAQRVPGMREYLPEEELIWDSSRIGTTPVSLRQCIAELLSWPPEHITIAKHFPDKFEWMVIKTLTGEQVIHVKVSGGPTYWFALRFKVYNS